ncbi:serine hydrolase domain-containing protein [Calothrix sp. UHCC 0171]|uniref:serine hydrolase domain-containing protein n=1 Tax=Calothrix sp. UHCC 0171 TaxID=3110245 RepID=UPI002B1F5608|nr:serine hydrolase domain-containing protein [Calothrix sp. UHCC 0171]MEA5572957.1 serine hydrolase domain-containing protein [Calothrix sp. UHCC 0171]
MPVIAQTTHPFITSEKQVINSQKLETFLDKYVPENMQADNVPGLVFALVQDGKILSQKAYGYANLEKKIPVIADKTLFRVASISKLFTATSVMQLVEQGKINLHQDVNQYLKNFQLDKNYPEPVTVANLLTHTGGLDVNYIGMSARNPSQLQPLGEHLAKKKPQRIFPPGKVTVYSNYGMALAGYLVEVISGVPFAEYIDKNIFQPLEIYHSSFQQPLPKDLQADLAVGYKYDNNKYQPIAYSYEHQAPAIALNATATDIAHFMIAHLQQGRYGDRQILQPETVAEMHKQHFTSDSRLSGIAYGFREQFRNNLRIIRHSGLIEGFVSQLVLVPQDNLGIFVACNSNSSLDSNLIKEIFNQYYPIPDKPSLKNVFKESNKSLRRFQGSYVDTITSQTTLSKLFYPYYTNVEVKNNGILVYEYQNYLQVEPLLFQSIEGDKYIAFKEDKQGKINYLFDGIFTLKKNNWYEDILFHRWLIIVFLFIFISTCLIPLFKKIATFSLQLIIEFCDDDVKKLNLNLSLNSDTKLATYRDTDAKHSATMNSCYLSKPQSVSNHPASITFRRNQVLRPINLFKNLLHFLLQIIFTLSPKNSKSNILHKILFLNIQLIKAKIRNKYTYHTKYLAVLISILNLIFILAGLFFLSLRDLDYFNLIYGINAIYKALLYIPLFTSGMTFMLMISTWSLCNQKRVFYLHKLYYAIITISNIIFILFINYWNLLGLKF